MERNTHQKQAIFETLKELKCHPTVAMIIDELKKRGHEVGRATVFRVLAKAEKDGLIKKISYPDGEDRYDARLDKHYHLRCKICGKITDSVYPYHEMTDYKEENGFTIETHNLEFVGICNNCKNNKEKK